MPTRHDEVTTHDGYSGHGLDIGRIRNPVILRIDKLQPPFAHQEKAPLDLNGIGHPSHILGKKPARQSGFSVIGDLQEDDTPSPDGQGSFFEGTQ